MKVYKKISIILALVLTSFSNLSAASTEETTALIALYNSTDGSNWTNKTNWNAGDPCDNSWYGVYCFEGQVSYLNLFDNNLTGTIPTGIENLTNLTYLELGENQLTGTIPSGIGNLTNLETLTLGHNQFTGIIPTEIGNLTNLRWLSLSGNQLVGIIPSKITNLIDLETLYLQNNCNLSSNDFDVQSFIDDVPNGGTYQEIFDSNSYNCDSTNPILVPIIIYLLN